MIKLYSHLGYSYSDKGARMTLIGTFDTEKIRLLSKSIGPTLVAVIANSRDQEVVTKWLDDASPLSPSPEQIRRLEFTIECLERARKDEISDDVTRAWLIGHSVANGLSPAEAIRSDDLRAAEISLSNLINDNWS
ncbi:MAG: hypothetical protein EOP52_14210 [Sphingobacteriales bacterium]|nr:MAG: hypothetical protein EOP52_14210 [Sphingobacteriales bacterium]